MTMHIEGRPITNSRDRIGFGDSVLPNSADAYRTVVKRMFDISVVLLAAPLVVPMVLILAAVVMLGGGAPFFFQDRVGKGGRTFRMWKLRTMVPNAEARLAEYLASNPAAKEEWDRDQKLRDDPRITVIGRILRKTSLDELPQLWNVLTGDMSLVGPRPMMVCQQDLYPGQSYFRLRPGITGSWQVSDRNETTFAARAEFDRTYDAALSLAEDVRILFATIAVVVRATGR